MVDGNTTPQGNSPKNKRTRSSKSGAKHRAARKHEPAKTTPNLETNGINFRAEQGTDNPIWQAVAFAWNRYCAANQNRTSSGLDIDFVSYTRAKFGPKTMTVGSQAA